MGRKKRKATSEADASAEAAPVAVALPPQVNPSDPRSKQSIPSQPLAAPTSVLTEVSRNEHGEKEAPKASNYAMTSHSADIIAEDIYVSDGSEDEDDNVEVVLSGSKMGLMRRGLHQPMLVQPNLRQWVKPDTTDGEAADETEEQQRQKEEEELAKLDPAERAARLLAEKQRKLEEAKESARRLESEENAGRDPCLFSKRTAFDIRFDQIDDKPWERGTGDLTDYFNYGLSVEDWLEYAQQQLMIRQELTDANRQKRPPDPNLIPVAARKPKSQTPKVAVASNDMDDDDGRDASAKDGSESDSDFPVIGPTLVKQEDTAGSGNLNQSKIAEDDEVDESAYRDMHVSGGAWGAGAAADSVLARLIKEQTEKENGVADVADGGTSGIVSNTDEMRPSSWQGHNNHNRQDQYTNHNKNNARSSIDRHSYDDHGTVGDSFDTTSRLHDENSTTGGYDDRSGQQKSYHHSNNYDWRQASGGRFNDYYGRGRGGRGGRHGNSDYGNGYGRGGRGDYGRGGGRWGGRGRGDYRRPSSRDDYGNYYQR